MSAVLNNIQVEQTKECFNCKKCKEISKFNDKRILNTRSCCIECINAFKQNKKDNPENDPNNKTCSKCLTKTEIKQFDLYKGNPRAECKLCRSIDSKLKNAEKKGAVKIKKIPKPGYKFCSKCPEESNEKELKYFSLVLGKPRPACKQCESNAKKKYRNKKSKTTQDSETKPLELPLTDLPKLDLNSIFNDKDSEIKLLELPPLPPLPEPELNSIFNNKNRLDKFNKGARYKIIDFKKECSKCRKTFIVDKDETHFKIDKKTGSPSAQCIECLKDTRKKTNNEKKENYIATKQSQPKPEIKEETIKIKRTKPTLEEIKLITTDKRKGHCKYEMNDKGEKICSGTCKKFLPLTEFRTNGFRKDGSIMFRGECKNCYREKDNERGKTDERKEQKKINHENNYERDSNAKAMYYQNNKDTINEKKKLDYADPTKTTKQTECMKTALHSAYKSNKRDNKFEFEITDDLELGTKISYASKVGCSNGVFQDWINFVIEKDNIDKSKMHFDHIIPKNKFNLHDLDEISKCNHYTNIMPVLGKTNLQKNIYIDNEQINRQIKYLKEFHEKNNIELDNDKIEFLARHLN